jgi:hypothetical protein
MAGWIYITTQRMIHDMHSSDIATNIIEEWKHCKLNIVSFLYPMLAKESS